jgi:hypothetical protein
MPASCDLWSSAIPLLFHFQEEIHKLSLAYFYLGLIGYQVCTVFLFLVQ